MPFEQYLYSTHMLLIQYMQHNGYKVEKRNYKINILEKRWFLFFVITCKQNYMVNYSYSFNKDSNSKFRGNA